MSKFRYNDRVSPSVNKTAPVEPADTIQLWAGNAFPDELPRLEEEALKATREFRTETLAYGPAYGLPELRDWIVEFLESDGVKCRRENILIVYGAKQGIDLACRIFINPGDFIIVTAPTYFTALKIFRGYGAKFMGLEMDNQGLNTEKLEEKLHDLKSRGEAMPKLLFDVPDFHNPTAITMSKSRRKKLVELAESFNFMVIEDDPYRRLRFEGQPVAPIKSFDQSGNVIAVGTFSKIMSPGIRVGWVNADPEIIDNMVAIKSEGGTCPLIQRIVYEYGRSGCLEQHVKDLTQVMRRHRDAMMENLRKYLPDVTVRNPEGGYFLWLRFPQQIEVERLYDIALQKGVKILPGEAAFPNEAPPNYVRLSYSNCGPEKISEGIRRLSDAYQELS